MAGDKLPSGGELFQLLVNGDANQQAIEQAIQKGLQSFSETANKEIIKLVEANTVGPDVSSEMQELSKTIINQTIEIIKNSSGSSSSSKSD